MSQPQDALQTPEAIAQQFVTFFYDALCSNRALLTELYGEDSTMLHDGQQLQGKQNILAKIASLPQQLKHKVLTSDVQPAAENSLLVVVCGDMEVGSPVTTVKFLEAFHLQRQPSGKFYIKNDIFRYWSG